MTRQTLVGALELDVFEISICLPCLSFVARPLGDGDEREVARVIRLPEPIDGSAPL